jgi:hypothetical protein
MALGAGLWSCAATDPFPDGEEPEVKILDLELPAGAGRGLLVLEISNRNNWPITLAGARSPDPRGADREEPPRSGRRKARTRAAPDRLD